MFRLNAKSKSRSVILMFFRIEFMKSPIKFAGFEVHPAANLFPMMTDQEAEDLKADIEKHGQILPIILYDGKILDGRNRAIACFELGIKPKTETWSGTGSPTDWVMSVNYHRRNLTYDQRVAVAALATESYKAEAEARRRATQNNDSAKAVPAKMQEQGESVEKAAKAVGVSARAVYAARKAEKESPGTLDKMMAKETTLADAKRESEPAKKETKREPQKRGSYADWQKFRSLCIQLEEIIDELAELQVDAPHERIARDTASKISRKLDKAINNI